MPNVQYKTPDDGQRRRPKHVEFCNRIKLIIQILFCYKTLHVSGIFSAHHQEFSTVHLALVIFMQVSDDRFQAESRWNCLEAVIKNLHETNQCRMYSIKLLMIGQRRRPKHVEFCNRIKCR